MSTTCPSCGYQPPAGDMLSELRQPHGCAKHAAEAKSNGRVTLLVQPSAPIEKPPCPQCGKPMQYAEPPLVAAPSWGCSNCWLTPILAKNIRRISEPLTDWVLLSKPQIQMLLIAIKKAKEEPIAPQFAEHLYQAESKLRASLELIKGEEQEKPASDAN